MVEGSDALEAKSALLDAYYALPKKKRGRILLPNRYIDLFGVLVSVIKVLVFADSTDECKASIDEFFTELDQGISDRALSALTNIAEDENISKRIKNLADSKKGRRYLEHALGAKGIGLYDALCEDLAFLGIVIDQLMQGAMPIIKAWENTLPVLSEAHQKELSRVIPLPLSLLQMLIDFEREFGDKILPNLPEDMIAEATNQVCLFDTDKFIPEPNSVDRFLNEDAENRIRLINEPLVKKLRGATSALQFSEDGISQAANSLIELIDRMLREFADPESVLLWLSTNNLYNKDTTYIKNNGKDEMVCPTKFGECLCFLYGGGIVSSSKENPQGAEILAKLYYYLAKSMTNARKNLQGIKHADADTPEEREIIQASTLAITGVIEIAHRFCWVYKGELPSCFSISATAATSDKELTE